MYQRIDYLWRVLATGICFTFFGLGGMVLSVIILPLQRLLIKDENEQKRIARQIVHHSFRFFVKLMAFLRIFEFSLEEAEQLKDLRGELILANHPSLIDVVVLISLLPNADCVVKTHLFKNIFIRGVINNTGYINNADPIGLLDDCESSLAQGNNLIIFPQGTRAKPEEKLHFQRGAANIAIRCQARVTAVLLKVVPTTLTKAEPWYKIPETKAHFSARVVDHTPNIPENSVVETSKGVRAYNRSLENFFIEELKKYE